MKAGRTRTETLTGLVERVCRPHPEHKVQR